jgi:hypothetical protein
MQVFLGDGRGNFTEDTVSGPFVTGIKSSMALAIVDSDGDAQPDMIFVANYRVSAPQPESFPYMYADSREQESNQVFVSGKAGWVEQTNGPFVVGIKASTSLSIADLNNDNRLCVPASASVALKSRGSSETPYLLPHHVFVSVTDTSLNLPQRYSGR